ncbi:MAG: agmatinase [Candidatus Aminicenantes bacterium]
MKCHQTPFLGLKPPFSDFQSAAVAVLPLPYEGGISYGAGTAMAPQAVLEASHYLELYDEQLKQEPYKAGIVTLAPPAVPDNPESMLETLRDMVDSLAGMGKWVVVVGGDHSISSGVFQALKNRSGAASVIQLDAHADLLESYQGSPFSHASVMARMREQTAHTLHLGIRSLSAEEAETAEKNSIPLLTMADYRRGKWDLEAELLKLPDPVFLTIDADVFDWSVIFSTGTPEPGGFQWHEALDILQTIFLTKNIIGCDVVELSYRKSDPNSPFAAAKLIYKCIGYKMMNETKKRNIPWPQKPSGCFFSL